MEITALLYWEIELIHKGIDINQTNNHNYITSILNCCGIVEAETKLKPPRGG